MPRILALDSSTEALSVALEVDGRVLENHRVMPRQHGQEILPAVERLLAEAGIALQQLDAIAFGRGPGSFTGLRIALGVVQGLAFGADLPVLPVSTLACLARTGWLAASEKSQAGVVLASIDARMDEVYWGVYRVSAADTRVLFNDALSLPADVHLPENVLDDDAASDGVFAVGTGCRYLHAIAGLRSVDDTVLPRAVAMLDLARAQWQAGESVSAEQAELIYLRDQVAWQRNPGPKSNA